MYTHKKVAPKLKPPPPRDRIGLNAICQDQNTLLLCAGCDLPALASFLFLTSFSINASKSIVAHFVHEAVEQGGGAFLIHTEFTLGGVVILLMDVRTLVCATPDTHHPQKLVDV